MSLAVLAGSCRAACLTSSIVSATAAPPPVDRDVRGDVDDSVLDSAIVNGCSFATRFDMMTRIEVVRAQARCSIAGMGGC